MMKRFGLGAWVLSVCLLASPPVFADVEVTLEQLPEPVRKTVVREVKGGTMIVYEVEFIDDAIKYEIDVAPDGTLLRRHRD